MRSSRTRLGPQSNDKCPYKKREREKTQREGGKAMREAETGAMHREANAHEGTPAAPETPRQAGNGSSLSL